MIRVVASLIIGALSLMVAVAVGHAENTQIFGPLSSAVPPTTLIGSLPSCSSSTTGQVFLVTNALLPVLGAAVGPGGVVSVLVRCNGTLWLVGQ